MARSIRRMTRADWPDVRRIFEEGIATGHATFTQLAPNSWDSWQEGKIPECCLVALRSRRVVGWVSLESASHRPAYSGVGVQNIYVEAASRGRGIGSDLLRELIAAAEDQGIWTLEARIFPENVPSLKLHEKLGFRTVGLRERLGRMDFGPLRGTWRDVLLLERRSDRIGAS